MKDILVESMARTLFVCEWADRQEEKGKSYSGQDLFDVAPKNTPKQYLYEAWRLVGKYEALNALGIRSLLARAAREDNLSEDGGISVDYEEEFGHYLTMMALGHGVSWFDSHKKFPLICPYIC
jgi:hypothetical protein